MPLIYEVLLIGFRKEMCQRGGQFLGWTYFGLEFTAVILTTLGKLIFSLLHLKKHIQQT
jgi:hypothetical protein